MADIIPFNNEPEEEQHQCETCDLVWEHMEYLFYAESEEQKFEILSELVHEAKKLGMKELLVTQIDSKIALLDHLDGCCEDEE